MSEHTGFRTILRATSMIGGASLLNILIGVIRTKVAALLLGPAGIGLIGVLQSLMMTVSTMAALGVSNSGTRQIAEASNHTATQKLENVIQAMHWGTCVLAALGAAACILLQDLLAQHVLGNSSLTDEVCWLSIGVAFTVISGSQSAVLNGLRRIRELAFISIIQAVLFTTVGIIAVSTLPHKQSILIFVLAAPIISFLLTGWYVRKVKKELQIKTPPLFQTTQEWRMLVKLGSAFLISGVIANAVQLCARSLIQEELGIEGLGHFQAAWSISMTYIGFALTAMGTDYYPRLTTVIHLPQTASRLVNEQIEVALLLTGPLLILLIGISPWLMEILYSPAFSAATQTLRLQLMGDMIKVASWPMGFIILAKGKGRQFILTELLAGATYLLALFVTLPHLGAGAAGFAYIAMYAVLIPVYLRIGASEINFKLNQRMAYYLIAILVIGSITVLMHDISPIGAVVISATSSLCLIYYSFIRISSTETSEGTSSALLFKLKSLFQKNKGQHDDQ